MLAYFYYRWGRKWWSRILTYAIDIKYVSGELPQVRDVDDVHLCLQKIKWVQDKFGDYVQLPIVTWNKKAGDCEDIAKLGMALLNKIGVKSNMLSVRYGNRGHAVCVFRYNGRLKYFDNSRYRIMRRSDTIYDIINEVAKGNLTFYAITDINGKLKSFKRRLP